MRAILSLVILGCGFSVTSAAEDEPEKLITELLTTLEKIETKLKKIDGKDAASKSLDELKTLSKNIDSLRTRSDKLKLDEKTEEALLKKYSDKITDSGEKINRELRRLAEVEGTKEILAEMKKMTEKMGLADPKDKK